MAKTLEQLIGFRTLTELVTTPVGGVQEIWPAQMLTLKRPLDGDEAEIPIIPNSRQGLPLGAYGGPSKQVDQQQMQTIRTKCVHSLVHLGYKQEVLASLKSSDTTRQNKAQEVIGRQTDEFRRRANNNRHIALNSAIRYGNIYTDAAGNILPSSSGATQTINLQRPAATMSQLGGIIDASWATAGTSILTHLTNIDKTSVQNTGRRITRAYYGSDVPKLLRANTEIAASLDGDSQLAALLNQGQIRTGFGIPNCVWSPLYTSAYTDSAGTFQYWFPADYVVFMTEVDRGWYELQEGSYQVPRSLDFVSSVDAALANLETVYGMFSYCQIEPRAPFGINHHIGDTFLPVFKDWGSCLTADTVF